MNAGTIANPQGQGFEYRVNTDSALKWIKGHRPKVTESIKHANEIKL